MDQIKLGINGEKLTGLPTFRVFFIINMHYNNLKFRSFAKNKIYEKTNSISIIVCPYRGRICSGKR
ncbi:MAG: hypothetical protein M0P58_07770, partial [Bacteroidales bacterium]|nr:hypothetical protein [Bacteroidales bacterium]